MVSTKIIGSRRSIAHRSSPRAWALRLSAYSVVISEKLNNWKPQSMQQSLYHVKILNMRKVTCTKNCTVRCSGRRTKYPQNSKITKIRIGSIFQRIVLFGSLAGPLDMELFFSASGHSALLFSHHHSNSIAVYEYLSWVIFLDTHCIFLDNAIAE